MSPTLTDERVFTIAQAARSYGLPESTLRYYEQIGAIPPARSSGVAGLVWADAAPKPEFARKD